MSKLSLLTFAAIAALTACSAAAHTEPAVVPAENIAPQAAPSPAGAPQATVSAMQTAAPPQVEESRSAPRAAISCEVRSRRTGNGVLIQARVFADRDIAGEYDLVITKSGGGNSSEINQSGPVSIAAGSSVTLGENEISVERGARVRAVLTLRDSHGQICRRSFQL
ncbi:MAG: curli-like amyloid fiber formation chaperone CsgH [Caulobacteraceae bacterium]